MSVRLYLFALLSVRGLAQRLSIPESHNLGAWLVGTGEGRLVGTGEGRGAGKLTRSVFVIIIPSVRTRHTSAGGFPSICFRDGVVSHPTNPVI
ncbi:hypothetical protein EVAR_69738_1 [Eumeta japonica]|uniref:Secreted protein n=1 Tax=Eumeta variegata TaxID=151549 RepID=A0A4C2A4A4_EUMVA|nr:hypothetical protein EVAR_69738_1 [Eumeta japonica]